MNIEPRLNRIVAAQPYPLIFATISGAHLYGFPSPDSDYDLRGAHVLPLENVLSLDVRDETVQDSRVMEGLEMDIVSHDARKFIGMLLKKNGYVLEQLLSPLVFLTTPEHEELKALARDLHHAASLPPLSRLRRNAVAIVFERRVTAGKTSALHLSSVAYGHSSDALRRDRSKFANTQRGVQTSVSARIDRAKAKWS